MATSIGSVDEFRHEPDCPEGENWQENYVFRCWDVERRSGWYLHLGHIRDHSVIDVRAMTIIDGVIASVTTQEPGSDCLGASDLDIDVISPPERIKISFSRCRAIGPDEDGFLGARIGDVDVGFDIEMISEHLAINWSPHDQMADQTGDIDVSYDNWVRFNAGSLVA